MSDINPITSASGVLPSQLISEWTEDDYMRTIRSIVCNWNYNVYQYNPNAINTKELGLPMRFADRCFWWSEYYFGRQKNVDFDMVLLRADGKRKALKMFRGKDVKKFIDDQVGTIQSTVKDFPDILDSFGISDNIVSARQEELDTMKFLMDDRTGKPIQQMLSQFGAYVKTQQAQEFSTIAAGQVSSVDWVDSLESAVVNIGKDFMHRNYWKEQFIDVAKDAYITGMGCAKVDIVNGYPLLERFPAYEAIVPPRNTGDQHRTDAYGGRMRWMTVTEIAARYPELGMERLKEIETLSRTSNTADWNAWNIDFNVGSSVIWWSNNDRVPRVGVADVQWASYDVNEAGESRQANRQGILIGNKYLIRQGLATNQVKDWRNPSHTNFDFMFVRPMSIFGQNMGIPETIYTYVNQIDMWQTKINEWIARAKGNSYILFTKSLPEGVDAQTIISDLSDDGLTVMEGIDMDAGSTQRERMTEQIQMELPQSIITLQSNIQMYRQMMADILNIPDQTRGQMKGYQSSKNIDSMMANSSKGTSTFSDPLNEFFMRLIQKAVDKFGVSTLTNKNIEYSLIVGDTQMEQFKYNKNLGVSRFGIYLKFDDAMDETAKRQIEQTIFAYAQNSQATGYTLGDFFTIQNMNTKSAIDDYLKYREAAIKAERMVAEQQAQAAAAANTERNAQAQENIANTTQDNSNLRHAATLGSKDVNEQMQREHDMNMAANQPQQ